MPSDAVCTIGNANGSRASKIRKLPALHSLNHILLSLCSLTEGAGGGAGVDREPNLTSAHPARLFSLPAQVWLNHAG